MIDKGRLEQHLNNGEREYIMCAAIYFDNGEDFLYKPYNIDKGLVYSGWRHPCIFEIMPKEHKINSVQGFLTNKNRFLTRDESFDLVKDNGQLKGNIFGGILTSEDLW